MTSMVARVWVLGALACGACFGAIEERLETAGDNAGEIRGFLEAARETHGEFGERAAGFLVEHMPSGDLRSLKKDFLVENLDLAMRARKDFPWAQQVSEELFFNDVLPYASLDETREPWRREFFPQCAEIVKECRTAAEAAQALNREFFKVIKVHYDTGRKAPNQSPSESRKLGMATCTGLSIILVDACRAVGVPARVAGTALWANKRGNHTWVEVHDGERWRFTGADEHDAKGLDRAWFVADAAKAVADDWRHAIWATSWKPTGDRFPMVWDLESREVPGVNVTDRYAKTAEPQAGEAVVHVRLWDKSGGERLAAEVEVVDAAGKVVATLNTRAGTADLNDMPSATLKPGDGYRLRVEHDGAHRVKELKVVAGEVTLDLAWNELGKETGSLEAIDAWLALLPEERHLSIPEATLSEAEAAAAVGRVFAVLANESREEREAELKARVVKAAGKEMKYHERVFGEAPGGGRSLWISMHGGGGAPPQVNEQQWHNQIRLYEPEEGIVVAPRAPTDTWNLWHEGHIDDLFDRLIGNFVAAGGVNPDRVYLMGYSAGGDGVYQLAPRMADRFAAASMMAGHPNDASPLGLRNLPFMIFMGGEDGAYNRNKVAAEWGAQLGKLRAADEGGYEHKLTIYEGLGHWMNGRDREALPWMAARTRDVWPAKLVWRQSGRTHDRFYWLAVPAGNAKAGQVVRAEVKGREIAITAEDLKALTLRLSDELLDLDEPLRVTVNGAEVFQGRVERRVEPVWHSLRQRMDPESAATATLELKW